MQGKKDKMNNIIKIRLAKEKDIVAICKILKKTWLNTYPNKEYGITTRDILRKDFDSDKKITRWKGKLTNKALKMWVAEDGDKIIGFCQAKKGKIKNNFSVIYILPQYQRMGIGQKFATKVFEWLGNQKPITTEVVKYNSAAISFYQKLGFRNPVGVKSPRSLPNGKVLPTIKLTK